MKRLSVIIPIHNNEHEIEACLNSIVNQIDDKLDEIILINDSSTDNSQNICELYIKKYTFIKLYTVDFGGPSPTRNYGIKKSKGKFILFIDADDWIESNLISKLLGYATQNLLPICSYAMHMDNHVQIKKMPFKDNELRKENFILFYEKELLGVLWNKMFDASIIKQNNLYFNIQLKKGEDLIFILEYINCYNGSIYYIDEPLYHYISKSTGINRSHKESFEDKLYRMDLIHNLFTKINAENKLIYFNVINLYFRYVKDIILLDEKNNTILKKIIKFRKFSNTDTLKNIVGKSNMSISFFYSFLLKMKMYFLLHICNKVLLIIKQKRGV